MSEETGRQELERRLIERDLEGFRRRLLEDPKAAMERSSGVAASRPALSHRETLRDSAGRLAGLLYYASPASYTMDAVGVDIPASWRATN